MQGSSERADAVPPWLRFGACRRFYLKCSPTTSPEERKDGYPTDDSPEESDQSVDVVLLMGPLYHLLREEDLYALREVARVLRPGGMLFATAISRYAALLDQLIHLDRFHESGEITRIIEIVTTGVLQPRPDGPFTAAFFHLPRQLEREVNATSHLMAVARRSGD